MPLKHVFWKRDLKDWVELLKVLISLKFTIAMRGGGLRSFPWLWQDLPVKMPLCAALWERRCDLKESPAPRENWALVKHPDPACQHMTSQHFLQNIFRLILKMILSSCRLWGSRLGTPSLQSAVLNHRVFLHTVAFLSGYCMLPCLLFSTS